MDDMDEFALCIEVDMKPKWSFEFRPFADGPWLMRIREEEGVRINRDAFPDMCPDDIAKAVIDIIEGYIFSAKTFALSREPGGQ